MAPKTTRAWHKGGVVAHNMVGWYLIVQLNIHVPHASTIARAAWTTRSTHQSSASMPFGHVSPLQSLAGTRRMHTKRYTIAMDCISVWREPGSILVWQGEASQGRRMRVAWHRYSRILTVAPKNRVRKSDFIAKTGRALGKTRYSGHQ